MKTLKKKKLTKEDVFKTPTENIFDLIQKEKSEKIDKEENYDSLSSVNLCLFESVNQKEQIKKKVVALNKISNFNDNIDSSIEPKEKLPPKIVMRLHKSKENKQKRSRVRRNKYDFNVFEES